jgi:Na+/H+ antiporter NhaC
LITIILALIIKEVISSLFIGLFLGAFIIEMYKYGFVLGFIKAFMSCLDLYIVEAMNDSGHISVIVFSLLIGGMVSVINNSGGMQGVVNSIKKYARSARSGQLATWALGIAIFFDDYANTLVVGKTMRPVTDSLKISREKLAYLVDSTAAPIASIALITTWIGAELGYIADGISNIEKIDEGVYSIFLNSLQYSYYPILSLIFILILIKKGKDYGPMLEAERLARFGRMSPKIQKSEDEFEKQFEDEAIEGKANKWLAIIPILILLFSTIAGLFYTAYDSQLWSSDRSFFNKLSETIGNSDSYRALLWGSSAGLVSSIVVSYFSNRSSISHLIGKAMEGIKGMIPAIAILVLAWSLAIVIEDLHTAEFLSSMFNDKINPYFIPLITFLLSAIIAFSTGSSWGTMAILYPLILPLSWQICEGSGMTTAETMNIFYNVVSSILAGSVLGDHCSPISDTTILSSLASDCDHIQHVRTQMPYALTVGLVACVAGTIPAAYGSPFWINLPIAVGLLWLVVHFAGEVADEEA